ncbi:MAG TPA: hypothetical protein DD648_06780 [Candidatus Omnitrophica bacterium]|nr:hypothetical protein [Candidatus Omnitrophota bacterium]
MKKKTGIEGMLELIRSVATDIGPGPACELFRIECSGIIKGKSLIELDGISTWLACATWPDGTSASVRLDPTDMPSNPLLTRLMGDHFHLPFKNPISRKVLRRKGLCQKTAGTDFKKFKDCDLMQFGADNVRAKGLSLKIAYISDQDRFSIRENMFSVESVNTPNANRTIWGREFEPLLKTGFTTRPPHPRAPARPHKRRGETGPAIIFSEQATSLLLENYFTPNLMRSNIINGLSCFKSPKEAASCRNKSDILVRLSDDFITDLGVNDTTSKDENLVVAKERVSGLVDTFDTGIDKEVESLFRNLTPKIEVFSKNAVGIQELASTGEVHYLDHIPGLTTNYDWRSGYEIVVAADLAARNTITIRDRALNIFTSRRYGVWKDPEALRYGLYYKNDGS